MIEKIKKYTIFIILILFIPAFIVFFMDLLYFLFINDGDNMHIKNNENIIYFRKNSFSDGTIIYSVLHIKACVVFSVLALLSFISSFYYRLYGLIYIFILSIPYVLANVLNYYGVIINPIIEFYFSLFISFIISSLLYYYIDYERRK